MRTIKLAGKVLKVEKAHKRAIFREIMCFILFCGVFIALGILYLS
jgi:hypothetical protein